MEKILKLYTYIDGINDTPFPSEEHQVVTSNFRGDYKRMGGAPSITCTIMHPMCLDKLWTYGVYAKFNGERFFIKQIPSSSYDNTDARYKHELELVSERIILDNVYVYDVVDSASADDKPVSNNSKFTFFGTVNEFAQRLNQSLRYSGLDYTIVVDDGITSDGKLVSFENQFFTNALQEIYNIFKLPYYFVGKVIHIGYTSNAITHTFKYGQDESLLSIQKQNANHKIVNRVTGVGSADNIPYYYPNDYESKEVVEANGGVWINPQSNLMPSIYRETLGKERFYNALDDTYVNPEIDEYYKFENQYIKGQPREHIVNFENVKPSIVGVKNASNQRIDMFLEFAYDSNDNDEFDDEGNYLHPYFFAKLRKFDGEYGFNLFDHAIDEDEMVISMTSGSCGSCEFIIGVDDETQKNIVQVDEYGNLKRDDKGNVKFGTPQDNQNDTINNEVWIALKKDINTFGVIMPNAEYKYRPSTNDTFVILHIDLPKAYILAAENNLKEQLIKYMAVNNVEKFNFSISFSRIFFAENPHILAQLDENARIQIEYDGIRHDLYVSSYSYNMSSDKSLPEIKVELSDTISVQQNALQNAISEVKQDIMSSVGSVDFLKQGLRYFLRKDTSDRTRGKLSSDVGFEVGKFVSGASGAIIQIDKNTGHTIAEIDKLYVRMKAYFETLEIISTNSIGGKMILSPAGSVKCIGVEEKGNAYRCYFLGEQDGEIIENRWEVGMQAYSQMFNAKVGVSNNVSNTYYWRLVTEKSENIVDFSNQKCHYIDLSKTDCDSGSDIPKAGDVINHRGSRNDVDYMNFIEFSSVGTNAPYITLFQGVNSYSLANNEYVSFGYDQSTGRSYMNVYGEMYVGDRNETSYMRYTQEGGLEIKGKLSVGTKLGDKDLKELIDNATPEGYKEFVEKVTQDIDNLQNQVDGAIDSYFYDYDPTLDNYPTVTWTTDYDKESHLGDTFTNNKSGDSWRWGLVDGSYQWIYIEDTATKKALSTASKAQDTADGKRRVFVGVSAPSVPYDKGDLWSRGSDYTLLVCEVSKTSSQSYSESDWGYADNTEKLNEEMKTLVNNTKSELEQSVLDAESAMKDYSDEAKEELQKNIDAVNSAKANVADVYDKATVDGIVDKAEAQAISKANEVAQAERELLETRVKAYADGEIDAAEQEAINEAQKRVDTAKAELEEAMSLMDSELRSLVTTTKGELNNAIVQATEAANSYADKGIAGAKQALEKSIDDLNKAKANVSDVYSKAEADGIINQAEADAIKAADDAAKAAIALADEQIRAYADGIVDDEEQARLKQAQENLQTAKDYADQKAQEAFNEINGYEYLKLSLKDAQSTEIDNGLVLTSLIQLRDKSGNIMSGINGLSSSVKLDKSIATWWGGDMNDLTDYYTWQNGEWKPKSGVTIPTSIPSGLIRFDGTGYLAKGKFWWDNDGRIYADPRALFLMFDVEDEAKSLSSTILAMLDKQTEFADMWAVKTDKNGNKYLYSKYNLVTQGGISMYSDATTLDVLNIYNGLPIDGDTIYWDGKVLKSKVGTEGAITEVTSSMIIKALGYTPYSTDNPSGYITISALDGYAEQSWVNQQGFLTQHQSLDGYVNDVATTGSGNAITSVSKSGKKITFTKGATFLTQHQDLSGYQTKITSSNKLAYSLISGTPDLSVYAKSTDVDDRINALINGAPAAYDTLKEIADVLAGNVDSIGDIIIALGTKADKATTLGGYGITDAKISNGVITLGGNTITPLTSHQTIYKLTFSAGKFSSGSFTANSAAKTINIPTTTSHISEDINLYFTDARAVAALTDTLKSYITLAGTQEITGEKNFTGGLKVNGSPIYYDSTKKYWKLEGDLLITGGVTMFGNDSSFNPSTITDAVNIDNITIKRNSQGQLYAVGGGEADSVLWDNITGKPNFASVATSGKYDDLIGKPTLLSSFTDDIVSGKYLPLSGGTLTSTGNPLILKRTDGEAPGVVFYQNDTQLGSLGVKSDGTPYVYSASRGGRYTIWYSGNDGSGSGLDADLLDGYHSTDFVKWLDNDYTRIVRGEGETKYLQIATFKINTTLILFTTTLLCFTRGGESIQIEIKWVDTSNTDPDLDFFRVSKGSIKFYLHKRDVSTWDLYAETNTGWGSVCLKEIKSANGSDVTITRVNKKVSSIPEGSVQVTYHNVASKLNTPINIWGQSFDGTGDVDGNIYGNAKENSKEWGIYRGEEPIFRVTDAGLVISPYDKSEGFIGLRVGTNNITDGSKELRVFPSGNVAIGASTDNGNKLFVKGTTVLGYSTRGYGVLIGKDGNVIDGFHKDDTICNLYINHNTSGNVYIATGGGNVGVGTNTPSCKLDIKGGSFRLIANVPDNTTPIAEFYTYEKNPYGLEFSTITSNGKGKLQIRRKGKEEYFDLILQPNGGNVQIGYSNGNGSGYTLDVFGNIRSTKEAVINGGLQLLTVTSNAYNDYGIILANGLARIGANTKGDIGLYSSNGLFLRPASKNSASNIGLIIDVDANAELTGKFTSQSLSVNGIPIYKSQDGVLYIEGNLAVKGGITMYAEDEVNIPSIIDSLPIAGYTSDAKGIAAFNPSDFVINDGVVSYIGKSSGVDEAFLSSYLVTNNYAKKDDFEGKYLPLAGGTITGQLRIALNTTDGKWGLMFSDGYGALGCDKTSNFVFPQRGISYIRSGDSDLFHNRNGANYTIWDAFNFSPATVATSGKYSDLTGTPTSLSSFTNDTGYITSSALSGYATESYVTSRGYITSSALNGYSTSSWVSSNFLSLGGGTISGSGASLFNIDRTDNTPLIAFKQNGSLCGYLGIESNSVPVFYNSGGSSTHLLHGGNYHYYSLPLSGGTITGDLIVNNTIYSNVFRSRYNRWMMGDDGSTMQTFGGNYNGSSTVINGNKVKINANEVEIAAIDSGGVTFRKRIWCADSGVFDGGLTLNQSAWDNGLKINRTASGGGAAISVYSNNTYIGCWGINGEKRFEFSPVVDGTSAVRFAVDSSGNGDFTGYLVCRGNMNISGVSGVNTSINLYSYDNSGYQFSNRVIDGKMLRIYYRSSSGQFTNVMELGTTGNLLVMGGITMYSDQRKKTILGNVELSLKDIANAPLIEHYYNVDVNKTTHVGSIAQYWYGLNDWFCKEDHEGYLTMEIQNAALASAISIARELDRYETKTDKTIKQLKKRICQLEEEIEQLKSA